MAKQQFNRSQIKESSGLTSNIVTDLSVRTYSTTSVTTIANTTATVTNAPPGDYTIDFNYACKPGANMRTTLATTATGTLTHSDIGIHGSDSDYNTAAYAHRHQIGLIRGHLGGTFTVTGRYAAEGTATSTFGLASDPRWATIMRIAKVG